MSPEQSQATTSLWVLTEGKAPTFRPLKRNCKVDVCIVGAGIAGLTTAYLLAREGKKVAVLDATDVGGGETGRTTAHLSDALDDRYFNIERVFGEDGSKLAAQSHRAAIDKIEAIARAEKIDCDFARLDGFLFTPPGESTSILERELIAARVAGLKDVQLVPRAPLEYDTGQCLCFPRQGQFHPMKYLNGLAAAIQRLGGRIHVHSPVEQIEGGGHAFVRTRNRHTVHAQAIVVATNTPVNDMFAMHTKQYPYRTYAVAFPIRRGSVTAALYWDTEDPYHYIRTQPYTKTEDYLIVGGEDHKTGQERDPEECFQRLTNWTRRRFPQAKEVMVSWSGQVQEPMDYLAYIGRNPGDETNVYIVTGNSGHGMTHGTIAGMLLTDLIMGRENPWEKLYDPARKTLSSAGTFLSENANVARQYLDWILPASFKSVDDIKPDQGVVVQRGLSKMAVYRDDAGQLHELSASCPHLGCMVHWNSAEKTWDCPCHGSRFSCVGKVINGPALTDLAPASNSEDNGKDNGAAKTTAKTAKAK
jgi:glycine/D-amino acid oxidase-like deaminating enzyme/nitrite reductase/ring-hydroxylating ferredoxin subunit